MAIEIKELHIKINVDGEGSTPSKKKQIDYGQRRTTKKIKDRSV